jgi:hypothetical protein
MTITETVSALLIPLRDHRDFPTESRMSPKGIEARIDIKICLSFGTSEMDGMMTEVFAYGTAVVV